MSGLSKHYQRASQVREEWKMYIVTPIFKADNQSGIQNHRPFALLSAVSKVTEGPSDDVLRNLL